MGGSEMTLDWYNDPKLKAEQKKWYAKLKAEGFRDIEGGVEGHLLSGPTPSMQLGAALTTMPGRIARAKGAAGKGNRDAGGTPKSDHWYDASVRDHCDKGKASYYHAAQRIACLAYHTRMTANKKYTWSMHSDGWGEPVIKDELGIPRSRVRKYLAELRESITFLLDKSTDQ
jgi:hypothetical protein